MAINLLVQYPGKVGPVSLEYPYGTPRNVSAPGAGDGTPWEEAFVRDLTGFGLALLGEGPGIVPSGNPDNAVTSQYLEGLINFVQARAFDPNGLWNFQANPQFGGDDLMTSFLIQGDSGGSTGIGQGDTFDIAGGDGIDTSRSGNQITIAGEIATTGNRGIIFLDDLNLAGNRWTSAGALGIQWGISATSGGAGAAFATFPVPFVNIERAILTDATGTPGGTVRSWAYAPGSDLFTTGVLGNCSFAGSNQSFNYIAVGLL